MIEAWVVAGCVLCRFDEDPTDVAVAFLRNVAVNGYGAGLMCARCKARVADKLLSGWESGDGADLVEQ